MLHMELKRKADIVFVRSMSVPGPLTGHWLLTKLPSILNSRPACKHRHKHVALACRYRLRGAASNDNARAVVVVCIKNRQTAAQFALQLCPGFKRWMDRSRKNAVEAHTDVLGGERG
jgi:hypothetical protein